MSMSMRYVESKYLVPDKYRYIVEHGCYVTDTKANEIVCCCMTEEQAKTIAKLMNEDEKQHVLNMCKKA